ncbi:MAG: cupredoxin domain-containing protein [Thermomicrobiales bacterium]|nr:cupredoxin domain-containing protein [Thermomicrobiales bacterium]
MNRLTFMVALATACVLALVLSACGGDASGKEPVATNQINLPPSYRFDPEVITVAAGTTVTWTNNDHFTHNVQVEDGEVMIMKPGDSVTFTFDTPGTYDFTCTYHPHDMQGQVIVTTS